MGVCVKSEFDSHRGHCEELCIRASTAICSLSFWCGAQHSRPESHRQSSQKGILGHAVHTQSCLHIPRVELHNCMILTSDFSSLFWESTCVMISFMFVSRTMPPITISDRILCTWENLSQMMNICSLCRQFYHFQTKTIWSEVYGHLIIAPICGIFP